jgi:lipopolysaccharide/colanic/teichoic acid biosynthesis glycosyltransferase
MKHYKKLRIKSIYIFKLSNRFYLMTHISIRILDFLMAFFGLLVTFPILLIITIVGYFDTRSPIFIQERVGKNKRPFKLIKFRTMSVDTKCVASHLASTTSITKLGTFLRKTKIDELPQLINVLKGEMSFVGPRPNLFNQKELITERDSRGVYDVLPGITGLAQVNTIDMSTPKLLAETDQKMIDIFTLADYFKYILQTATGKGSGDGVTKK